MNQLLRKAEKREGKRKETRWMQLVAKEMNLSETAFLWPLKDGFSLRWFTPAVEVDLCGHAILACTFGLWEAGFLKRNQKARFFTRSVLLTCKRQRNWII